jgi:flagellar biosynthesis/type III secretory pathway M-ring protein FliF/YscJ
MLARLPAAMPRVVEECVIWIRRKRTPALAVAGVVICIAVVVVVAARTAAPVALFDAPLHPRQTAEVAQALTLWNEPYTADPGGTQIFVTARRRRDLLVRLALADLPHRYVPTTADVLQSQDNPLTPPEVVDDRRRTGIEGDLVLGLRRIDGVADATVMIAPASGDTFADAGERAPPSASVQIILQPGAQLSAATVAGIRRFVAAGYPGLNPDRVAVVDGSGAVLGAPTDRAATRETRIQRDVQSALDAALGIGAAIVRVSVRTAGSDQSVQSTRVVPHGLLDADIGREVGAVNGRKLSKERTARHYAYDTIVEHRTTPADALGRISVAVFLDAARTDASSTSAITALVRAAAGADLDAGDDVVVEAVPFAARRSELSAAAAPAPIARAVVPVTALLLAIAAGFTFLPQRLRKRPDPMVTGLRTSLDRESPRTAAYILSTLPAALRDRVLASYGPLRRANVEACLRDARR